MLVLQLVEPYRPLVLLSLLALLAGSGPAAANSERVLRIGIGTVTSLDPHRTMEKSSSDVLRSLCEGLTTHDAAGRVVAGAAQSWSVSPDGLTWTFQLRSGLLWSDGQPMTAEDWVWSFRTAVAPDGAVGVQPLLGLANAVAIRAGQMPVDQLGVEAPAPDMVRLTLGTPQPDLPGALTQLAALPRPRHVIEQVGAGWATPDHMVCNGAFTLEAVTPGTLVRARRNETYHAAGAVAADAVEWIVPQDSAEQARLFFDEQLHVSSFLMPDSLAWAKAVGSARIRSFDSSIAYFLLPNFRTPPFLENPELARALSLALDRDLIALRATAGAGKPRTTFVPPGFSGWQADPADWTGRDRNARLDEARAILAAAGYGIDRPLRLDIHFSDANGQKLNRRVMTAVAAQWSVLGVKAVLVERTFSEHLDLLMQGNWSGLARRSWSSYAPENYLRPLLTSPGAGWTGFSDPRFAEAMAVALGEGDPAIRLTLLARAERLLLETGAVIPLMQEVSRVLVSEDLEGWEDNHTRMHPPRLLSLRRWRDTSP
ncbi:MAG: hypothetical protein RLY86_1880 [Pseudomonadota bacterium]